MITAEKVSKLSTLKAKDLDIALKNSGYSGERPMDCTFLGITTSGDFCYKFTYRDDESWSYGKAFVNINATGMIVADY